MPLNLTKVAYGHDSLESLRERLALRASQGEFFLTTRYRPRRYEEIAGGSLYWIIRHKLVARSPILGFDETEDGRTALHLEPRAILVAPQPKRAHQGWRYLEANDAPADLGEAAEGVSALPPHLVGDLSELALL